MQHLDPDRLVILAFSEEPEGEGESVHLAGCRPCRDELADLRDVVGLGSQGRDLTDLPAPPEHVWQAIEAEIERAAELPQIRRRPSRRWLTPVLSAAAAAVLAVAVTVGVSWFAQREPRERVTARASLTALPSVQPSAGGSALVLSDGKMRIDVRNLPPTTGFHEVWLIDPDDPTKMVAIGNLPDSSGAVLPVPPGTDLSRYRLVDVSDEAHDGNVGHSGHSLLRGTLTS